MTGGAGWTPDRLERRAAAEAGSCVVANLRGDAALLGWAQAVGRYVRIDRRTPWGNPFLMGEDGDHDEVCAKFRDFYLPHKPGLQTRLPSLRGKVLACWCHPQACHGHLIAEAVNGADTRQ